MKRSKLAKRGFDLAWAESNAPAIVEITKKHVREKRKRTEAADLEAAVHDKLSVRYCPHCRKAIDASLW